MAKAVLLFSVYLFVNSGGSVISSSGVTDEYLRLTSCNASWNFHPHSSSTPAESLSHHAALESMISSPPHAACALCHLCHINIRHRNLNGAYNYAIRALTMFPRLVPAMSCLSALYFQQGNILRAGFYAELAYRSADSASNFIYYEDIQNGDHLHVHFQAQGRILLRQQQLTSCADFMAGTEVFTVLRDVLKRLEAINQTLVTAYLGNLHGLPRALVGPGISAYEAFLDLVERAEDACTQFRNKKGATPVGDWRALHLLPEDVPRAQWPPDKTIIIFSYVQMDTVRKTFGENVMGLSDALNKLGVPHRILSRSIPEDDFVTILNIGKIVDEDYGKYVFWNYEKNPSIQQNMNMRIGRDEKFDSCGNDVMRYSSEFIGEAEGIWESVLLNLVKWPDALSVQFVPALLPDQLVLLSKLTNEFAANSMSGVEASAKSKVLEGLDAMRPIDVLFFGSSNAHRESVHKKFRQLADERDLNIVFFMNYSFFGVERELAIQQSKIVLNLANFRWPYTASSRPESSVISSDNGDVAEQCGAATNFHRIRSLLARGKVILSERSGSTLEESLMSEFVVFADSDNLVDAAVALLQNREQRFQLESAAVGYMLQDHHQGQIQHSAGTRASSLGHLAQAVTELAANMWPSSPVDTTLNAAAMTNDDLLAELVSRQVAYVDEIESQALSREKLEIVRGSAALGWAEVTCLLSDQELEVPVLDRAALEGGLVGVTNNASSACHHKSNLQVLLGYVARRYQYKGKILMIGFVPEVVRETLQHLQLPVGVEDGRVHVVAPGSADEVNKAMESYSGQHFDLVVVNQRVLLFGFLSLQRTMLSGIALLEAGDGVLVINNMLMQLVISGAVDGESELSSTSPGGERRDSWKLLADVRQHDHFDAALANFDDGLLICCVRRNPYVISAKYFLERSARTLVQFLDRVVPVLNLAEVHTWMSNSSGTRRFVRTFKALST